MEAPIEQSDSRSMENIWDSPVGGAYLIWRFVKGFCDASKHGPNLLLVFPAMAIVMDASFSAEIVRSGNLSDFAFAFHDSSGNAAKSLSGLQDRINDMRGWILRSLEFSLVTRLIEMDPGTGTLAAILKDEKSSSARMARAFKDGEGRHAENLGCLFARTKESDIAYYLGVKF